MKKIRVGVIFGGRSGEHEVSIISAQSVISAFDKNKYEIVPIYLNKKGQWQIGFDVKKLQGKQATQIYFPIDPTSKEITQISGKNSTGQRLDVIFPVLHGTYGEDGSIQGLFELSGIPYVGSGVAASSVGMDKDLMKKVFGSVGLPITKHLVFLRKEISKDLEGVIKRIEKDLDYPLFTKPANLGSSVGISKSTNEKELRRGLVLAAGYDRKIIAEQGVKKAREIEVAVLGNDSPEASVCGEVVPSKEFYDFEDKYILNKAQLIIPAYLPKETSENIRAMAKKAFKAIDAAGMARVDFLLDQQSGEVFIQEINTIPGFTAISMYPKLWQASGVNYSNLIDRLIELAIERYNERQKNKTNLPSKLLK